MQYIILRCCDIWGRHSKGANLKLEQLNGRFKGRPETRTMAVPVSPLHSACIRVPLHHAVMTDRSCSELSYAHADNVVHVIESILPETHASHTTVLP